MKTQVNNLSNNTSFTVNSSKQNFIEEMNKKANTSLQLDARTDNGWYALIINETRMTLEITEIF